MKQVMLHPNSFILVNIRLLKFLLHTVAVVLVSLVGPWLLSFPGPALSRIGALAPTELLSAAYAETKHPVAIDWQTLRDLDFRTGHKTPAVAQLVDAGVLVRVPGFMVPLEDEADAVTEFLLVPYSMACIHVPPPPPNQIIHVKMAGATKQKVLWAPIWVQGHLRVIETSSKEASYTMTGVLVERYE